MKRFLIALFVLLICSTCSSQGVPQMRTQENSRSQWRVLTARTFVSIPLRFRSAALISEILGGDVIWDDMNSSDSGGSGDRGNSGGSNRSDQGNSDRGNSDRSSNRGNSDRGNRNR